MAMFPPPGGAPPVGPLPPVAPNWRKIVGIAVAIILGLMALGVAVWLLVSCTSAAGGTPPTTQCPPGMTCTPAQPAPAVCPAGMSCTPQGEQPPSGPPTGGGGTTVIVEPAPAGTDDPPFEGGQPLTAANGVNAVIVPARNGTNSGLLVVAGAGIFEGLAFTTDGTQDNFVFQRGSESSSAADKGRPTTVTLKTPGGGSFNRVHRGNPTRMAQDLTDMVMHSVNQNCGALANVPQSGCKTVFFVYVGGKFPMYANGALDPNGIAQAVAIMQ